MSYNSINLPIEIKKIFLRFLQAYYSEHFFYKWEYDISKTKIVIVDKHSFDTGIAIKRPSIVLSRGDLAWSFMTRGQLAENVVNLSTDLKNFAENYKNKNYTDLIRTYMTFNVLSGNGVTAEMIANEVFTLLTGHKEEFRKLGVHQFTGLSLGTEQIIRPRGYAEVDLYGVTISLSFLYQHFLVKKERLYNVRIIYDDKEELKENIDFFVIDNGTKIKFVKPLEEGKNVKIYFIDAITEENIESGLIKMTDLIYLIPNNRAILGYYKTFSNFGINIDANV